MKLVIELVRFCDDSKSKEAKMWALFVLFVGCSLSIPNTNAADATVFLKTTDAVNLEALKAVDGVSSVYKVKPILFYHSEGKGGKLNQTWNYVVVGQGLKDSAAQDKLISDVGGMEFVDVYAGYRLSVCPNLNAKMLNNYIKRADQRKFVKRPMTPASPKPECSGIDLKEGESVKLISMNRQNKGRRANKMVLEYVLTIFPALKVSYDYLGNIYAGQVSSGAWNNFQILDYNDVATWCEYAQSQYAKDFVKKYPGVVKGVAMALGVEV